MGYGAPVEDRALLPKGSGLGGDGVEKRHLFWPFFDRKQCLFQKYVQKNQKHVLKTSGAILRTSGPPCRAATGGREEGLKRKGCFSSSPPPLLLLPLLLIGRGGRPAGGGRARNNTPFFTPGKKHTQNAHLQKRQITFVVQHVSVRNESILKLESFWVHKMKKKYFRNDTNFFIFPTIITTEQFSKKVTI